MKKLEIKYVDPKTLKLADSIRADDGDLTELAASIKEHGVLNPIEVDLNNVVVTGRRRLLAAKSAMAVSVPVRVLEIDSEAGRIVRQLIENVQRLELPPMDRAKAFSRLHEITGWSMAEIARHVGIQRYTVDRLMPLVNEPEYVQEAIASGQVGYRLINEANKFPAEVRDRVKERLVNEQFATHDALSMIREVAERQPERAKELIERPSYRIEKPVVDPIQEHEIAIFNAAVRLRTELQYVDYFDLKMSTQRQVRETADAVNEWLGVAFKNKDEWR